MTSILCIGDRRRQRHRLHGQQQFQQFQQRRRGEQRQRRRGRGGGVGPARTAGRGHRAAWCADRTGWPLPQPLLALPSRDGRARLTARIVGSVPICVGHRSGNVVHWVWSREAELHHTASCRRRTDLNLDQASLGRKARRLSYQLSIAAGFPPARARSLDDDDVVLVAPFDEELDEAEEGPALNPNANPAEQPPAAQANHVSEHQVTVGPQVKSRAAPS